MKIFQLNASYKPAYIYGGPTMSVSKLSEEIHKQGIDVEVITTTANGPDELKGVKAAETIVVDGVPVTYYPRITKDHTHFSPALISALKSKIQKAKAAKQSPVVHVHAWWNLVSIFAAWVARWKNVPVILSPRGTLSGYSFVNKNSGIKDYIHKFLGKGLLEYSYFHVTSEKEKRDVERLVKPKGVFVIPNFVRIPEEEKGQRSELKAEGLELHSQKQELRDEREAGQIESHTEELKAQSSKLDKESQDVRSKNQGGHEETENQDIRDKRQEAHAPRGLKLLFISRVEEKKGLDLLFECLKEFKADWHLDIAGSGDEVYIGKLKNLAKDYNFTPKITWLGHVNNEQKFQVMEDHDVMVLPSFDENFANVVIECLSVGTAVLLTRNVGLADYAEEKGLGWVCERTKEDLLTKLQDINPIQIDKIKASAPQIIREDFSEARLITEYVGMYEEVLSLSEKQG